jgi:hypothetical protein
MKISEVVAGIDRTHEYMIVDPVNEIITVYDQETVKEHGLQQFTRLYRMLAGDECEEVNIDDMVKVVVDSVCSKIKMRDFLKKVLVQSQPMDLLHAYDILHAHPEAAKDVKSRDGCVYLDIPNPKPGEPNAAIYLRF